MFYTWNKNVTIANNQENNPDLIARPLVWQSMDTVIHTYTVQMFPKCQPFLTILKWLKIKVHFWAGKRLY